MPLGRDWENARPGFSLDLSYPPETGSGTMPTEIVAQEDRAKSAGLTAATAAAD
jgi:hypothetical protein